MALEMMLDRAEEPGSEEAEGGSPPPGTAASVGAGVVVPEEGPGAAEVEATTTGTSGIIGALGGSGTGTPKRLES